jgi:hypothetical protein
MALILTTKTPSILTLINAKGRCFFLLPAPASRFEKQNGRGSPARLGVVKNEAGLNCSPIYFLAPRRLGNKSFGKLLRWTKISQISQ